MKYSIKAVSNPNYTWSSVDYDTECYQMYDIMVPRGVYNVTYACGADRSRLIVQNFNEKSLTID